MEIALSTTPVIHESGSDLVRKTVFMKPHLGLLGNTRKVGSSRVEVGAPEEGGHNSCANV
jgi:hypothetical protein